MSDQGSDRPHGSEQRQRPTCKKRFLGGMRRKVATPAANDKSHSEVEDSLPGNSLEDSMEQLRVASVPRGPSKPPQECGNRRCETRREIFMKKTFYRLYDK